MKATSATVMAAAWLAAGLLLAAAGAATASEETYALINAIKFTCQPEKPFPATTVEAVADGNGAERVLTLLRVTSKDFDIRVPKEALADLRVPMLDTLRVSTEAGYDKTPWMYVTFQLGSPQPGKMWDYPRAYLKIKDGRFVGRALPRTAPGKVTFENMPMPAVGTPPTPATPPAAKAGPSSRPATGAIPLGRSEAITLHAAIAVDLTAAYGTMGDNRMKEVIAATDGTGKYLEPYGKHLAGLYRQLSETGVSNVALVSARDIAQAVEETHLLMGVPDNRTRRQLEGQHPWLFIFLGVRGSSPPARTISSVRILDGKTIEVRYQTRMPGAETRDMHPYMAFIPLPKDTPAGVYTLKLIDERNGAMELQRRSAVVAARPREVPNPVPKVVVPHVPKTPEQEKADELLKRQLENAPRR